MPWTFGRRRPTTYLLGEPVDPYPAQVPEARRGRALRITEIGEPVLHGPARRVEQFSTPELARLVDDLFATMEVAQGVGLAAPQVGVDLRVFVYDLTDDRGDRHVGHVVNPVLEIDDTAELVTEDEGCLSVPGAYEPLARRAGASVRGVDQHGGPVQLDATGYLARAFIHECQHLDGVLYWDHLSRDLQRDALRQRDEEREGVLADRREIALELGKRPADYPEQPAGGR
ncbi:MULTISPECIES: peptide deformylase [unclassified Isoptericola]|uniref:peptide deformylase n=1 Tax=unclassified Isoptericola TaxID=2623355 RepID=UPI0027124CA0|nr:MULTISPECIES: peptide deformylase [unclassified Isoptericola]MDO8143332.1 peptide deformylase [Isoptericola sp. 178]MDO8147195.1 peptide deformylase [Isoptericola sp. b515]MDO8150492.1 peptide deformylase [Isoptericola sp. b408]